MACLSDDIVYINQPLEPVIGQGDVRTPVEGIMQFSVYGTPQQCYDHIRHIYEQSHCCASINAFKFGGMPFEDAQASLRLFAKEVLPELRTLGADPLFDSEDAAPLHANG